MNFSDLEIVVLIGLSIIVGSAVASKSRIAEPIVLLLIGASLGFVPGVGDISLPPSVVLYLFVPALLYWESLNTSVREIRANARSISMLATGLVLLTAAVVAVVSHTFGVSWTYSIVLGAILAPTDATAVSSVAGRLPRRMLSILRGESLINDGTALVLYSVAVAAILAGKEIDGGAAALLFLVSYAGGALIGIVVALVVLAARRKISNPLLSNSLSVLTPFLAFLPAQFLGISGVIAVVACGLVLSQLGSKYESAATRIQSRSFWALTAHLLNGALFVLVGLQLHAIWGFSMSDTVMVLEFGLSCTAAVIGVRWVWIHTAPSLRHLFSGNPREARQRGDRQRIPLAWSGFRGAVSLAAALALPIATTAGQLLPQRNTIIAVTFIVIVMTLLLQGLSMPMVIRRASLEEDPAEAGERLLAATVPLQSALDSIAAVSDKLGLPDEAQSVTRLEYENRLSRLRNSQPDAGRTDEASADEHDTAARLETAATEQAQLQLALIPVKRAALLQLRSERRIDDTILRGEETNIDIEELRLVGFIQEE